MPALVVLGRRWHIAADDLPLPSLMGGFWHMAILVLISVDLSFVVEQLNTTCPYRRRHIAYLSSHLCCFFVNSILHTWTFFESIRGSIFQVHRRRRVVPLVLAVVIFYGLTISSNVYGTRQLYLQNGESRCSALPGRLHLNHDALLEVIVVATWISIFIGFIAMVITLNLFSTYQATNSNWLSRFRLYRLVCICCLSPCGDQGGGGANDGSKVGDTSSGRNMSPMVVIANVFTHMFGRVDMTLTDYIAAFTLLGVRHNRTKPALAYCNAQPPRWLLVDSFRTNQGCRTGISLADRHGGDCSGGRVPICCEDVALQAPTVVELSMDDRSAVVGGGDSGRVGGELPQGSLASAEMNSHSLPNTTSGETATAAAATATVEKITLHVDAATNSSPRLPVALMLPATGDAYTASAVPRTITTTTTTTTSKTNTSVSENNSTASMVNAGACNGAAVCSDTKTHTVSINKSEAPQDAEVGGSRPASPLGPTEAPQRTISWPQLWGSHDFAQPNASKEVMQEALHYMRFAMAVYGWKMYLWMNRLRATNCCRLCLGRNCGCCRQLSYFIRAVGPDYGPSEGCCSAAKLLEREAITQMTGVPDDEILYVCYDNRVGGLLPYYVAVDRQRRSVVVAVRGSLSLSDVVTDLLCEPAEYDVPGVPHTDGSGRRVLWAHRGMLESTRATLADLQKQGVLAAATADWPADVDAQKRLLQQLPSERARAVASRLRGACSGFRVVVTGHSLGAGVTGLLGPLLHKQFNKLRCWAFAPPGGLMSPKAAELTHGICISLVHAKDMIPRLAVNTMEQLVQDLVNVGVYSRIRKLSIIGSLIMMNARPPLEELFLPPDMTLKPELQKVLDSYSSPEGFSVKVADQFVGARDFLPPGHMLYVERRKRQHEEVPCCTCNVCMLDLSSRNANYICRWIQVKDLMEAGLVISRSMFLDHLPDNTLYALERAVNQLNDLPTGPPSSSSAAVTVGLDPPGANEGSSSDDQTPTPNASPPAPLSGAIAAAATREPPV
ncbi:hypothetical protein VaNZ11_009046 [Volvox africanus]|uniref:sn-1-specific diacylglycerol lipase n=1 Tax=Volvox africanus TaxID=51714 RepID=A0ABQ5S7L6_9CHLO|nr:hypothetical protein VaNZ11_009046 [Volvox africanus]